MESPKNDMRECLLSRFAGPQRPRVIEDAFRERYGIDGRQAPQLWDAFCFAAYLDAEPADLARAIGDTFGLRPLPKGLH
tara:strand:+ start:7393 stop:7629 length:237 start_codon:yes stop_codon:yes gene_type:complete